MRKSFVHITEVWDYKDEEEFKKHLPKKKKQGFAVMNEYTSQEDYTVEYRRQVKP